MDVSQWFKGGSHEGPADRSWPHGVAVFGSPCLFTSHAGTVDVHGFDGTARSNNSAKQRVWRTGAQAPQFTFMSGKLASMVRRRDSWYRCHNEARGAGEKVAMRSAQAVCN